MPLTHTDSLTAELANGDPVVSRRLPRPPPASLRGQRAVTMWGGAEASRSGRTAATGDPPRAFSVEGDGDPIDLLAGQPGLINLAQHR